MRPTALVLALGVLLVSSAASADVAPPSGYVETCTPALQQRPGTECLACDSYFGSMQKCPMLLGGIGFTKACQSQGASVWTEVWCRAEGGKPVPRDVSQQLETRTPTQGQGTKHTGVWIVGILLGVALAALGLSKCRESGVPLPKAADKQSEGPAFGEPDASKRVGGARLAGS